MARKHVSVAEFKAAIESGKRTDEMIITKNVVMQKAEGEKEMLRVRTFEVSNESVDRDGDVIKQNGVDWKNFMKNPVVLFAHNAKELPIGKGLAVRRVGTKTLMDIEFAGADANPKAEQVLKLLDGGFLNAGSIGFTPKEVSRVSTKERDGFDIEKSEALEFSIVPVPANADALHQAKEAGLDVSVCKEFIAGALKAYRLKEDGDIEAIPAPKVEKGLYTVGRLADILQSLDYIEDSCEYEREYEGDDSTVPEQITAAMHVLGGALIAMVQEEVAELLGEESGETMKAAKAFLANMKFTDKVQTKTLPKVVTKTVGESAGEAILTPAQVAALEKAVKKEVNDTAQTGDSGIIAQLMAAIRRVLPGAPGAPGVNDTISSDQDVTIDVVPTKEFDEAKALANAAIARARAIAAAE